MLEPIRIALSEEEERILSDLRVAQTVPQRTRDRAHMVRLNAQGWNVPAIAEIFNCHEHNTVRATLRRWQQDGHRGLWDAPGRGTKAKWTESDMQYLERCLEQEPRTYNSAQLAQKLSQERRVKLSADWIRRVLQKRAGPGSEPGIANVASKTHNKKHSSKQT